MYAIRSYYDAIADAYALTIVGGGETAMAVHRAGESESISFISTGGGAALELLEGKQLPGLTALPERVITSYSIHYTKLYDDRLRRLLRTGSV